MENKQAIIDNLEALLTAVKAQPENLFDLDAWMMETSCGTAFCVAGLAASMPRFKALGMSWNENEWPMYGGKDMWDGGGDALFGERSMRELFEPANSGTFDFDLGLPAEEDDEDDGYGSYTVLKCTDKELAIARLEHRIATYKESLESA